jgi:hypothetical protein
MSRTMRAMSTWLRLPGAPAIAAALLLAATEPVAAQMPGARPDDGTDRGALYYTQCALDWDPGTHMTKQEWLSSCRRLARDRHDLPVKSHKLGGQP